MYSGKHYSRVDGHLKRTFYVRYVLGQMTLLEDETTASAKTNKASRATVDNDDDEADDATKVAASSTKKAERKREKKSKGKTEAKIGKHSGKVSKN